MGPVKGLPVAAGIEVEPKRFFMERLKRRTDFRAAATGARAPLRAFVLQAKVRGEAGSPRIGFTVSRQVGTAVERNRVRRRLREMVRLAPAAGFRAGHDYVLIGRRAALGAPFDELIRDFDAALHRVHAAGGGRSPPLHEQRGSRRSGTPEKN